MDSTGESLLKLLFDPGENISVSNNQFAYHSIPLEKALSGQISLLSTNDFSVTQCDSSELILVSINPIEGFRKDSNVSKFRTFLWECDTGSIQEQLNSFKKTGLPISAQVFSGNKSVHAVTVLEDKELPDEKTYRHLYLWALKILTFCDQNCKNPSRSVRIPGAYREPGKKQRLISLKGRIKLEDFYKWLNQWPQLRPMPKQRKPYNGEADYSRLSGWAKRMMSSGITFRNGRNQTWFALAVDFALAGFTEDQTIELLSPKFLEEHDFKEKEWLITVGSAFKYVANEKNKS